MHRLAAMTLITDGTGTHWVEIPPRKRRPPSRAVRFADVKVGDQLARTWPNYMNHGDGVVVWHYVVTDLWFDPVAGQRDETAGRMVAIQRIDWRTGNLVDRKEGHTLRGLASQGFRYAGLDYMSQVKAVLAAKAAGDVVGIGMGHVIRRRPKKLPCV
jgi:hypothetical protein